MKKKEDRLRGAGFLLKKKGWQDVRQNGGVQVHQPFGTTRKKKSSPTAGFLESKKNTWGGGTKNKNRRSREDNHRDSKAHRTCQKKGLGELGRP